MAIICPAILASSEKQYQQEVERVAHFAHRLQIDLTDGDFAKQPTIKPDQAWWPVAIKADFHLMYKTPATAIKTILTHRPHLIIIHAEADGNFEVMAAHIRERNVKVGVALLQHTSPKNIVPALELIDHVLIFSGNLGSYGGQADFELLEKVAFLKQQKPELEIGWDGGVDDQNVSQLVSGGVDVLNVGGFIQNAEYPHATYTALQRIADETGTT